MPDKPFKSPSFLVLWIGFCAYWSCVGWALSALGQLNPVGYGVALGLGLAALAGFRRLLAVDGWIGVSWRRLRHRFSRRLPLGFLVLAVLAFLGGAIYAPNSYDALAYRVPRLLHWLAESRWHWIHTEFNRLNSRGCGFEWLAAPVIALTKSDRFLFLYNVISFSLLPGLIFSSFRRFGVRPRVAYAWMWVVPVGYCFLLQAGSLGNDLFVATLVMAGIDLALRARASLRIEEFWLSLVAFALGTGVKANALPMALAWLVLIAPCWRCFRLDRGVLSGQGRRPAKVPQVLPMVLGTAVVGAAALLVSFFPTAVGNWRYGGEWTGSRVEKTRIQVIHPVAGPIGNAVWFVAENLAPPVAPFAKAWNQRVAPHLVPSFVRAAWDEEFLSANRIFQMDELQTEEEAGLGLSVSGLLAVSVVAAWRVRHTQPSRRRPTMPRLYWLLAGSIGLALLAVFRASAVQSLSRLVAPYYMPMVMLFLVPEGHERLVRAGWWRWSALGALALGGAVLVLSPARPLFPTSFAGTILHGMGGSSALVARVEQVYEVYAQRASAFAPAVELLPPEEKIVGIVTFDDPEASLWKPFGGRRVVHVCLSDTPERLRDAGVHYVWVSGDKLKNYFDVPLDRWLRQFHGRVVRTIPLTLRADSGAMPWHLVRLSDSNEHAIHLY